MKRSSSRHREIARETVRIIEWAGYVSPNGRWVNLEAEIAAAQAATTLYLDDWVGSDIPANGAEPPRIEVANETTFAGAFRLREDGAEEVFALNFASARNMGGGFLNGAQAQEECLCRASALYGCLLEQPRYYDVNRAITNALYTHAMIYAPNVPVFRDDHDVLLEMPWLCSILTAPAPNAGAIRDNTPKLEARIPEVFRERIRRVLRVARNHQHRHLVLGAWGCGVFRNDPRLVAGYFKEILESEEFSGVFSRVRFSVLDTRDGKTYRAFAETLAE